MKGSVKVIQLSRSEVLGLALLHGAALAVCSVVLLMKVFGL